MITVACENCQKSVQRFASQARGRVFCSKACSSLGRTGKPCPKSVKRSDKGRRGNFVSKPCKNCNTLMKVQPSLKDRKNYCTRICYEQHKSVLFKGENNPAYKNGSSFRKRDYRGDNWNAVRMLVYRRDGFCCTECGCKCVGRRDVGKDETNRIIQCHHIEPYKINKNNSMDNLRTLCLRCHGIIEAQCKKQYS
jgi:hypothetical protein